jgi:hypothetical protein
VLESVPQQRHLLRMESLGAGSWTRTLLLRRLRRRLRLQSRDLNSWLSGRSQDWNSRVRIESINKCNRAFIQISKAHRDDGLARCPGYCKAGYFLLFLDVG